MIASTGALLALALTAGGQDHNGTNGFRPADLFFLELDPGTLYDVDWRASAAFARWLREDPSVRSAVVDYFVRCALPRGVTLQAPPWRWEGDYGLAEPGVQKTQQVNVDKRPLFQIELGRSRAPGVRWVSACLMAFANLQDEHPYVSLRGNPPGKAAARLKPSDNERWAMGYPEGLFFADLFSRPAGPNDDLEESFTLSLNLPDDYEPDQAGWLPPNAALGRTLDFQDVSEAQDRTGQRHLVATRLGTRRGQASALESAPRPSDPDHREGAVCLTQGSPVPCAPAAERYPPIFVHLPRLANLEDFTRTAAPEETMQVLDRGSVRLRRGQRVPCAPEERCIGAFALPDAPGGPRAPARIFPPARLAHLGDGQAVVALLRLVPPVDGRALSVDRTRPFTAIVRYRSFAEARAVVEVGAPGGGWQRAGESWPATGKGHGWMQVFPVYAAPDPVESGGKLALAIRISGAPRGASAPELDVAGFVNGPPTCLEDEGRRFMGVCPDGTAAPRR